MKKYLLGVLALALLASSPASAENTKIKFTLDWKLQGIHGWFYLAKQKGYFADEGLDVTIDQGEGSAATVTRIISGAYDAGFGDMNAIIQTAATKPDEAPVMVYQMYVQPPFAVLAKADGPIQAVKDMEGRKVAGGAGSSATRMLPALAKSADIDLSKVEIVNVSPSIQEQMLIQGNVDASLVFNVTAYLNIVGLGMDPEKDFKFFGYGDSGLEIYSNGVMVSQKLVKENPEAVKGLVKAINRAVMEVIADPALGGAAVKEVEPLIKEQLEVKRLEFAIKNLMTSDESLELGVGGVDMDRLSRSILVIKDLYDLPTTPAATAVYTDGFLPRPAERTLK